MRVLLLAVTALLVSGVVFYGNVLAAPGLAPTQAPQTATLPASPCDSTTPGTTVCNLWAGSGSTTLPDGASVPVWGYTDTSGGTITQPGGPILIANQGDVVTVNLTNTLPEASALLFQGQAMIPDLTGAIANGGTMSYTFTATDPGTFLYEAGLLDNAQHQVAMGLYGALVVRPDPAFASVSGTNTVTDTLGITLTDSAANFAGLDYLVGGTLSNVTDGSSCTVASLAATTLTCAAPLSGGTANSWALNDAYTAAAAAGTSFAYSNVATSFDDEALLVLSEIDPVLNNSADPAGFDMRNYQPRYRLINGKAYPDTDEIAIGGAGNRVLLRYVNAALEPHSMGLLGLHQTVIANDGSSFKYSHTVVADTLAPGETQDTIATIPATTVDGSKFALYDASLLLRNSSAAGAGGMLTFVAVGTATPPGSDTIGPATSNVTLTPAQVSGSMAVDVNATVSDVASGGSNITAAEYYIDSTTGLPTAMSATDLAFDTPDEAVTASIPAATVGALTTGNHTIYVRGQDSLGNWGALSSAVLKVDNTGPATSGLTLMPNPTNGTADVALSGTANDSASGGSNITAAEYWIDGGAPVAMNFNTAAPIANVTAVITATTVSALSEGPHTVSVRSQDTWGNWGDPAAIDLIVDKTGPTTSNVAAAPNPTNGMIGYNSTTAAVRVSATFTDALSNVKAGEGFIDTVGANGTGFIFVPSDGAWNSPYENGYANVPLATIRQLSDGSHTISVHSKDAAGNWSTAYGTVDLIVDRTSPTLTSITLTPDTIAAGTLSVTLDVVASDNVGVTGGQYWIDGTAVPPATATAFAGTSTPIDTSALVGGNHTVYVRVHDGAMNWSTVSSAALVVIQAVDDSVTISANTQATQQVDIAAPGVLANDEPIGAAGRTAALATGPVRIDATGNLGTITVTCPSLPGSAICADGSYRITLNADPAAQGGSARRASKRGTFEFTYTEILNGVTSTATVTITVN